MKSQAEDNQLSRHFALDYLERHPVEAVEEFMDLGNQALVELFLDIPDKNYRLLIENISSHRLSEFIEKLDYERLVKVLGKIDPEKSAAILGQVESEFREKILNSIEKVKANEVKSILEYSHDSAGQLMDRKFPVFRTKNDIGDILDHLRKNKKTNLVDFFVLDNSEKLIGALTLHEVVMSGPQTPLSELVKNIPHSVADIAGRDEILELMEKTGMKTVPVLDHSGRYLGAIEQSRLVTSAQAKAGEDLQAMFGVSREERAGSSMWFSVRKRLPWLQINLATGFLASSVVGVFEDTIAKITFLAVLLPIVAGQSGNTGSQALAVTLRGMALREVRSSHWWRLARKEFGTGLINGSAVAVVTAIGVFFWSKSLPLAWVTGTCMVMSMVIAGVAGTLTPIILKSLRQDPATSSSIILTTVTDVSGFASFLGLATLFTKYLI